MKFIVPVTCTSCGNHFASSSFGEQDFPPAECPQCHAHIILIPRLSISLVSDLLIHRSQREIDDSDFTVSIVCSAMAVETALTQVFLKWKDIEQLGVKGRFATDDEKEDWEEEYRKGVGRGGFVRSANFVSEFLIGKKYDSFIADFAETSSKALWIAAGLPSSVDDAKGDRIHKSLFVKRNRVMHWGEVGYGKDDAVAALQAAATAVCALKVLDRQRFKTMENEHQTQREEAANEFDNQA